MKTNKVTCGNCGQPLSSPLEYHTHESCLLYKLNSYRTSLGKPPIVINLEVEDGIKQEVK